MTQDTATRIKRNLWVYSFGVLAAAALGGAIMAEGNMAGGLVLVLGPVLMNFALRQFAGDGWKDSGLRLNFRAKWRWYVLAFIAYPATQLIVLIFGGATGLITFNVAPTALFLTTLTSFVAMLPFHLTGAIGEELGWRGYMEPRLAALGVPQWRRAVLVGVVWALWHVPLILATPYTDVPLSLFLPLFLVGAIVASFVYSEVRQRSGTVWTAVLMHGIGNTVLFSILGDGTALVFHSKTVAFFGLETLVVIVVWACLALLLVSFGRRGKEI